MPNVPRGLAMTQASNTQDESTEPVTDGGMEMTKLRAHRLYSNEEVYFLLEDGTEPYEVVGAGLNPMEVNGVDLGPVARTIAELVDGRRRSGPDEEPLAELKFNAEYGIVEYAVVSPEYVTASNSVSEASETLKQSILGAIGTREEEPETVTDGGRERIPVMGAMTAFAGPGDACRRCPECDTVQEVATVNTHHCKHCGLIWGTDGEYHNRDTEGNRLVTDGGCVCTPDHSAHCGKESPGGYKCTRPEGHPGQHVACSSLTPELDEYPYEHRVSTWREAENDAELVTDGGEDTPEPERRYEELREVYSGMIDRHHTLKDNDETERADELLDAINAIESLLNEWNERE